MFAWVDLGGANGDSAVKIDGVSPSSAEDILVSSVLSPPGLEKIDSGVMSLPVSWSRLGSGVFFPDLASSWGKRLRSANVACGDTCDVDDTSLGVVVSTSGGF